MAVSDSRGGIYNEEGLELEALYQHKTATRSCINFGQSALPMQLELPVDILIPAALKNQITAENAARVKARIVAEAANGPTTPEASRILYENGTTVIPDILANAGGVTVSYFEWVQNLMNYYWSEEEVYEKLQVNMFKAFAQVYATSQEHQVDLRTAAFIVAIKRVADAIKIRGIV